HDAAVTGTKRRYSTFGSGLFAAFLPSKRQTAARSYGRRHERLSYLRLAGQRARAAHRHRTWRGDGDRTQNLTARSTHGGPASGRGLLTARDFPGESVR